MNVVIILKNNHLIEALRLDDSLGNFSGGKPPFPECTAGIKLAYSLMFFLISGPDRIK